MIMLRITVFIRVSPISSFNRLTATMIFDTFYPVPCVQNCVHSFTYHFSFRVHYFVHDFFSNKFRVQKCVHVCTDLTLEINIEAPWTSFVYSAKIGNGYFLFKSSFYFDLSNTFYLKKIHKRITYIIKKLIN